MSGGLLTTLRYGSLTLGLLSTLSPYLSKQWRLSPNFLRPMLNVSWGYLFGSHVYELLADTLKDSKEEDEVTNKKGEFTYSDKFFLLAVLGNSMVLMTTFGLAPSFRKLQLCSYVSLFSTLFNYFLVVPCVSDKKTDCMVFKLVKPKTLSRLLLLATLLTLTLYTVS